MNKPIAATVLDVVPDRYSTHQILNAWGGTFCTIGAGIDKPCADRIVACAIAADQV